MKQQPNGKPRVILLIAGNVFNVLSLHHFSSGKLCWSMWSLPGDVESALPTSGKDTDGPSVQELLSANPAY